MGLAFTLDFGRDIIETKPQRTIKHNYAVHFTMYRGSSTAKAPRSETLKRDTTSLLNSASELLGAWVTVTPQFSM